MATLFRANESEVQFRLYTEYLPTLRPDLAYLWPRFETWADPKEDCEWIGIVCDHPKSPRAHWFDPPSDEIFIRYRLGRRHQWLLAKNDLEWRLRRVRVLMGMLLNRLAMKVKEECLTP